MGDAQAARQDAAERTRWMERSLAPGFPAADDRWYAENTRESVRLLLGGTLSAAGAVVARADLAPTSPAPRWALAPRFADYLCAPAASAQAALDRWLAGRVAPGGEADAGRAAAALARASAAARRFVVAHPGHPAAPVLLAAASHAGEAALRSLSGAPGAGAPEVGESRHPGLRFGAAASRCTGPERKKREGRASAETSPVRRPLTTASTERAPCRTASTRPP